MKIHDGHVHTPFCPHGSTDPLESYVLRGIELGLSGLTFTEHAPLPRSFTDPTPDQDSAMTFSELDTYVQEVTALKEKYQGTFNIFVGLEVDFIEGFELETKQLLDEVGPYLDDSILSVHFLKDPNGNYHCLDYSEEAFAEIVEIFGSLEAVYERYFETVKRSITAELGRFKPKRIGHVTLVNKFQKIYPPAFSYDEQVMSIIHLMKEHELSIDYNSAGVVKPLCKEAYPPERFITLCEQKKIPLIYGSDAHSVKGLLQGFEQLKEGVHFATPTRAED